MSTPEQGSFELASWFTSAQPSPIVQWLSFVLAFLLAASKLWGFIRNRLDRSHDRQLEFSDAWFKVIVLDSLIAKFANFTTDSRNLLKDPPVIADGPIKRYQAAYVDFQRSSEAFKSELQILRIFSVNAHGLVVQQFESLEDGASLHCAAMDGNQGPQFLNWREWSKLDGQFSKYHRECILVLRQIHWALYNRKPPDKEIVAPSDSPA